MPRKSSCRFVIPGVDKMRADTGASPHRLAGMSGCSTDTVDFVLAETPRTKNVCEKVINGLKRLGHPTADHGQIVEVESEE